MKKARTYILNRHDWLLHPSVSIKIVAASITSHSQQTAMAERSVEVEPNTLLSDETTHNAQYSQYRLRSVQPANNNKDHSQ